MDKEHEQIPSHFDLDRGHRVTRPVKLKPMMSKDAMKKNDAMSKDRMKKYS